MLGTEWNPSLPEWEDDETWKKVEEGGRRVKGGRIRIRIRITSRQMDGC
jgi:hypothetical protein